jgi:hypothetical protein
MAKRKQALARAPLVVVVLSRSDVRANRRFRILPSWSATIVAKGTWAG